jgi:LPS export ABC transporter protein LptC
MIFRVIGALALIALIGAGLVILDRQQLMNGSSQTQKQGSETRETGYSARHAEIIETGPDGRPMYIVRAENVRQIPEAQAVMLETVRMEMRDDSGQRWTGRADYGQIFQDAAHIQLTGDVLVSGTFPGSQDTAEISTERLSFDTRSEIVKTRSPVTLNWGGKRIRANGLVANLKDQSLRLESQVHGLFQQ